MLFASSSTGFRKIRIPLARALFAVTVVFAGSISANAAGAEILKNSDQEKIEFIKTSRALGVLGGQGEMYTGNFEAYIAAYGVRDIQTPASLEAPYLRQFTLMVKAVPAMKKLVELTRGRTYKSPLSDADALTYFNSLHEYCLASRRGAAPRLNQIEELSICLYTMNEYKILALATSAQNKRILNYWLKGFHEGLKSALAKLPDYESDSLQHAHYATKDEIAKYTVGKKFKLGGFLSASKPGTSSFGGRLKFNIKAHSGKDIQMLSTIYEEGEVLFAPGTKFIVKERRDSFETTELDLEEI